MEERNGPEEAVWIDEVGEGHRSCPVRGETMHIERRKAVAIDVCTDHGIWLDQAES